MTRVLVAAGLHSSRRMRWTPCWFECVTSVSSTLSSRPSTTEQCPRTSPSCSLHP